MSLENITRQILGDVSEALAVAVVDLESGLLLSVAHSTPYFTQSYLDAVAAAAVDMFRGKTISTVEKLIGAQRGKDTSRSVREVQMTTDGTFHFMATVPGKPNALALLVTSRKANLGMGWSALRTALPQMAPLCP